MDRADDDGELIKASGRAFDRIGEDTWCQLPKPWRRMERSAVQNIWNGRAVTLITVLPGDNSYVPV